MRWLLTHPIPRSGLPALVGALLGLMTNFIAGAVQVNGKVAWAEIPRQGSFWIAVVILVIGIYYQKKIFEADQGKRSVLEKSKEGLADSLGTYYSKKIADGNIQELEDADKKLRKIFSKD